jgi:hypothetical protein
MARPSPTPISRSPRDRSKARARQFETLDAKGDLLGTIGDNGLPVGLIAREMPSSASSNVQVPLQGKGTTRECLRLMPATRIASAIRDFTMTADQLEIDTRSVFDNIDARQIEFEAEVDGDEYQFAVQYSVLEALTGEAPDGDAEIKFTQMIDTIKDASLTALSRDSDREIIVVSENDLDQ